MTTNVPPIDSKDEKRELPTQLRDAINNFINWATSLVEDVVKPSVKTFLQTCDTNPQIAVVVATPALLAFMLAFALFFIGSLFLVLWSLLTISVAVAFVVLGGLISLAFKLFWVVIATIPLAGIATALLVAANSASQFIIQLMKLHSGSHPESVTRVVTETEWSQILERFKSVAQLKMQEAPALLRAVWDALSPLFLTFHSLLHTALERAAPSQKTSSSPKAEDIGESLIDSPIPPLHGRDIVPVVPHATMIWNQTEESPGQALMHRVSFKDIQEHGN